MPLQLLASALAAAVAATLAAFTFTMAEAAARDAFFRVTSANDLIANPPTARPPIDVMRSR